MMGKLKFKECENCNEWNGNRTNCANICSKPYEAWDGFNIYMELEEQELLIRLPCRVGDVVYFVDRRYDRTNNRFIPFVHNGYVKAIKFSSRPTKVTIEYEDIDDNCGRCKGKDVHASNIGKTVFLTKEEAEAALAEMG